MITVFNGEEVDMSIVQKLIAEREEYSESKETHNRPAETDSDK